MPRTRYIKSPEQIGRLEAILAAPSFRDIRTLAVTFESDPAVLAELIPPPLMPAATPHVTVSVSEIRNSNCVGPFNGCSVNIACEFEGQPGLYCLTMPMSTDSAVIFGRELFAEPKKLAGIQLDVRERQVRGTVTRHGITYIELFANLEGDPVDVTRESTSHHYYFKYLPAANGRGLAGDPELVRVTHRGVVRKIAPGQGTVTFRESAHDPVIDVPVLSVLSTTYAETDTHTSADVVARVAARDFMPYAFVKTDDLLLFASEGELVRAGG